MPATILLVRHAEKPLGDGPPHGVTIDGVPDPESLTPRGWQRAGALVSLFAPGADPRVHPTVVPTPTHLFASMVGADSSSRRPRETLEPLAARLGLAIDTSFLKEQAAEAIEAIREIDGVVLVSWEHRLIPMMAERIVGDPSALPAVWPSDRYDVVWVFERGPTRSAYRFRQVPQMLLAGDRPDPIGASPEVGETVP
jgi:broad specificity phosphatase PhoE